MNRTYEEQLNWYRDYIRRNEGDTSRRVQGYVNYLKRWFSNKYEVDGAKYDVKIRWKQLPMPYNIWDS